MINITVDDFSELFDVSDAGQLSAREGPLQQRAAWNAALLLLDHPAFDEYRGRLIEKLRFYEGLRQLPLSPREMKAEEILLKDLADHWIFFHAFEIAIAPPVRESIENEWRKIRDAALA